VGYRPEEQDRLTEDAVDAHLVLKDEVELSALDFQDWCEKNLARFMRPRYVVFRDSLPKTATNRIQRFKVRDEGIKGATKLF
jgi:crotonobetaine/carnitine-CoA ligase